jgi:ABC-type lipoprotein export system ATPase subunit
MILHIEQVSKRFPRPADGYKIALDEVSLELDQGQIMGIFGPSGSGKTTLLRIAAGLEAPDSGTVTYRGKRLDQMSRAEQKRCRRREIACVWAGEPLQKMLSVLDHVSLPLLVDGLDHATAERRAHKALLVCEAEQCVGMEVCELSDGERQRVSIARALVTEPKMLLADGPAASLSLIEQEDIMVLLSSLAHEAEVAVLLTNGDAEALLRADPILYLCDGRLVTREPTSERGKIYQFPLARPGRAAADA